MRILKADRRLGVVSLVPQGVEDVWDLYNIVEADDYVSCQTQRALRPSGGPEGEKTRVTVHLTVRVEGTELDLPSETLKVGGVVVRAPETVEGVVGRHHSLKIRPGLSVQLQKGEWLGYQWRRLLSSVKRPQPPLVVVAVETGSCAVGIVRQFGVQRIHEVERHIPGKTYAPQREQALGEFFEEISDALQAAAGEESRIVLVGPGFAKNELAHHLEAGHPGLWGRVVYVGAGTSGTAAGVHEALRSGAVRGAAERIRAVGEYLLMEEVLRRIGVGKGDVAYGFESVRRAVEMGAVERLIVSEALPAKLGHAERMGLEELMRMAESARGRVVMVSPRHEAGQKLEGLGGVCALLRYPLEPG